MKKLTLLFLLFGYIALSFGCSPAIHSNLRNDLLVHNIPLPPADFLIENPITLKLKEGAIKRISGDCDVYVILYDKNEKKRFEISGTIFLENSIVRVADAISFGFNFNLKYALIRVDDKEIQITKYNINELFKKDKLEKIFNEYMLKLMLNKSAKEISIDFIGEKDTIKSEDSIIWKSFYKDYIKSLPIKTGDKLYSMTEEAFPAKDIKNESFDFETFVFEEEVKGIKNISGIKYLSTQLMLRIVGRFYDEKAKKYIKVDVRGGGYKLYEIPNLYSSKFVGTFYVDSKEFKIALGISFDGNLITLK